MAACVSGAAAAEDPFAGTAPPQTRGSHSSQFDMRFLAGHVDSEGLPSSIGEGVYEEIFDLSTRSRFEQDVSVQARLGIRASNVETNALSETHDVELLEGYVRLPIGNGGAMFTLGRQVLGWSSGFRWSPAEILESRYRTKAFDLYDIFQYVGQDLVGVDFPSTGVTTSLLLASSGATRLTEEPQLGVRVASQGRIDWTAFAARIGDYSYKYGGSVAFPFLSTYVFNAEIVRNDIQGDRVAEADHYGFAIETLSGETMFYEGLIGINRYFNGRDRLALEYFHNGGGLDSLSDIVIPGSEPGSAGDALAARIPMALAQYDYGRDYLSFEYFKSFSLATASLNPRITYSLTDDSYLLSLAAEKKIGESLVLSFEYWRSGGSGTGEFSQVADSGNVRVGVHVSLL